MSEEVNTVSASTAQELGVHGDDLAVVLTLDKNGQWRLLKGPSMTMGANEAYQAAATRVDAVSVDSFDVQAGVCRRVKMPDGSIIVVCS